MREEQKQILTQGLLAGLLGYGVVAAVFALANLIVGRSMFYTAAVLGGSLFYGIHDPSQIAVRPDYVFAYNGVHLVVFLAFGMVSAWLAAVSERLPQFWYVGLVMFFFIAFHIVAAMQAVAIPVQHTISGWAVWTAGAAAATVMAAYLLTVHPRLRQGENWAG